MAGSTNETRQPRPEESKLPAHRLQKIKIVAIPKHQKTFILALKDWNKIFGRLRNWNLDPLLQSTVQTICRAPGLILPGQVSISTLTE